MNTSYDTLIQTYAAINGIDPAWAKAIIATESNFDPFALRYESSYNFLYQTEKCAKAAKVSLSTEIATQKISWGLAQVMGALAREQGFTGGMAELTDPELNIRHLFIRLRHLKSGLATLSPDVIFAGYNGGPGMMRKIHGVFQNQKYVDTVNLNLNKLLT